MFGLIDQLVDHMMRYITNTGVVNHSCNNYEQNKRIYEQDTLVEDMKQNHKCCRSQIAEEIKKKVYTLRKNLNDTDHSS